MVAVLNPALEQLLENFSKELVFAQVVITRLQTGFELRHVDDRAAEANTLRRVAPRNLRDIARKNDAGEFRPLKSAPNLPSGWRAVPRDDAELDFGLNCLYPGAVADWFAAQGAVRPVTDYRPFTQRQTGMYRLTAKLSDIEAGQAIRACCAPQFCLKQRLWTVEGLETDSRGEKSLIACLEPCAVMLEFARTVARVAPRTTDGMFGSSSLSQR